MVKIFQVGAYPPPFGGVTVHLQRLHDHLLSTGKHSVIFDLSGVPKTAPGVVAMSWPEAREALRRTPRAIVHFHNFTPGMAAEFYRAARRHVVVLSFHNERFPEDIGALGPVRASLVRFFLRRLHCIVVDSDRCLGMARSILGERADVRVIPEFIPPATVPPLDHSGIAALRQRHRFLLATNAWKISFHRGADLYGLDLLVDSLDHLVREHGFDAGLAVLVPGAGDEAYVEALRARCRELGLADRVLFVREPISEAASLWRAADIVVRATNTDGNSLSIHEALSLGVPVVASDCVERPPAALLFRTRDAASLTKVLASTLANLPTARERVHAEAPAGSAETFVALYDELAGRWMAHAA
jgi:glycosyltransferase involved in cell wall biosynthesis